MAKTKSITIHKFDVFYPNGPDNPPSQTGYKLSTTTFNENGQIIEEEKYNPDGSIEEKNIFKYDIKGNLIEEQSFLEEDELADHKTYEWDNNGKMLRMLKHYMDGSNDTVVFTYNEQEQLVKKVTIDSDDEIEATEDLIYRGDHIISRKAYDFDELVLDESMKYDENGILTEQKKWTIEDEDAIYHSSFNKEGNLTKTRRFDKNEKLLAKTLYQYNDNGQLIKIEDENKYRKALTLLEYDDQGNAIGQTELNDKGETNSRVIRKFNKENQASETEVMIDHHGRDVNQHYILKYEYSYFE